MDNTHECPYCGDIFRAKLVSGPPGIPPCLDCYFSGKEPMSEEDFKLKQLGV